MIDGITLTQNIDKILQLKERPGVDSSDKWQIAILFDQWESCGEKIKQVVKRSHLLSKILIIVPTSNDLYRWKQDGFLIKYVTSDARKLYNARVQQKSTKKNQDEYVEFKEIYSKFEFEIIVEEESREFLKLKKISLVSLGIATIIILSLFTLRAVGWATELESLTSYLKKLLSQNLYLDIGVLFLLVILFFHLKQRHTTLYGCIELIFCCSYIVVNNASVIYFFTAMYIGVRGLDNIFKDDKNWGYLHSFRAIFLKKVNFEKLGEC